MEHHLECCAISLERLRDGDQRLHQRGRERIHGAEDLDVRVARQQRGPNFFAEFIDDGSELLFCFGILGLQQPFLGNEGQISILERDAGEAAGHELERVAEAHHLGPCHLVANELFEVALTSNE